MCILSFMIWHYTAAVEDERKGGNRGVNSTSSTISGGRNSSKEVNGTRRTAGDTNSTQVEKGARTTAGDTQARKVNGTRRNAGDTNSTQVEKGARTTADDTQARKVNGTRRTAGDINQEKRMVLRLLQDIPIQRERMLKMVIQNQYVPQPILTLHVQMIRYRQMKLCFHFAIYHHNVNVSCLQINFY